jgi:hypothetical protein
LFDISVRRGNVRLDDDRSNYTVCLKEKQHTHTHTHTHTHKAAGLLLLLERKKTSSCNMETHESALVEAHWPKWRHWRSGSSSTHIAFTTAATLCKPGCMCHHHHHLSTWTRAQFELRVAQPKNNSTIFLPTSHFLLSLSLPFWLPKRQPVFHFSKSHQSPIAVSVMGIVTGLKKIFSISNRTRVWERNRVD